MSGIWVGRQNVNILWGRTKWARSKPKVTTFLWMWPSRCTNFANPNPNARENLSKFFIWRTWAETDSQTSSEFNDLEWKFAFQKIHRGLPGKALGLIIFVDNLILCPNLKLLVGKKRGGGRGYKLTFHLWNIICKTNPFYMESNRRQLFLWTHNGFHWGRTSSMELVTDTPQGLHGVSATLAA